jgi:hypothetical protein
MWAPFWLQKYPHLSDCGGAMLLNFSQPCVESHSLLIRGTFYTFRADKLVFCITEMYKYIL